MTFAEQAQQEIKKLTNRKKVLQAEVIEIDKELKALNAYVNAKAAPVARRTGVRRAVLDAVPSTGITRAQLLQKLDHPDRSVDNALSALVKAGKLTKTNDRYSSPM